MRSGVLLVLALIACFAISEITAAQLVSVRRLPVPQQNVDLQLCGLCVNFMSESINELLNIILNVGVIGTCGELCGYLPKELEQAVCNLLCDYVGITEFIKAINAADLDAIYGCQLLDICPHKDCAGQCVKIQSLTVSPPSGPTGSKFEFDIQFTVFNQTGTGEIDIDIIPPVGFPLGGGDLVAEGFKPGTYVARFNLQAEPNEDDPFNAGTYKVDAAVCEGECGSKHPHSRVFDVAHSTFQITN